MAAAVCATCAAHGRVQPTRVFYFKKKKKKEGEENYLPTYGEQVISFEICEKTSRILLSLGELKDWAPLGLCTCLTALGKLSSSHLLRLATVHSPVAECQCRGQRQLLSRV